MDAISNNKHFKFYVRLYCASDSKLSFLNTAYPPKFLAEKIVSKINYLS